ncbi:MAG: mechanosensitive ion channel [Deltaproteobacteria bacterium]|nr:mechanosensitive ion channel [Deltaproteobacteria bacterium]MBW2047651.1 mechanosensitive ion channel [Deltaproteobacteria bacterium]MBW2110677.1 mechanosensitive ion channel [Deltaproteobacteria bacterium]MBW2351771.1 mechanosensitive ion channel [Deltaproteobacteria bacterium]HDZ90865.1 mechanosensitive ion channel [Deltaproteobacteria bacterium]
MQGAGDQVVMFITTYGIKVVGAIIILVIGRLAAGTGRGILKRTLEKRDVDPSVVSFVSSLTYVLILAFTVVAALAKFGIQTASFVAVLGAAGLAVGLALQGSLANFAAGVLILVLRPYRVGDVIDSAGVVGAVKEIQLFTTVLRTADNIKIMVPNGKIFGGVIKNITGYDTRRVDMVMGIGYSSDIQKAFDVMTEIMKTDARILPDPAPQIAVSELADSSVNLVVRPWVKKEDYWNVKFDLTRKFKEAFDKNGIDIPYPQHVVHMARDDA